MKHIKKIYVINSPVEKVWEALVNPEIIEKWGGGPAKMKDLLGFKFSLWGGDIHGKNIKVVKNKTLVQEWFSGEWDKPSIATFNLESVGEKKTKLELFHVDVPDTESDSIDDGWDEYYLGPLKNLLENY